MIVKPETLPWLPAKSTLPWRWLPPLVSVGNAVAPPVFAMPMLPTKVLSLVVWKLLMRGSVMST